MKRPRPADSQPWRPWRNEDLAWAAGAHFGGLFLWAFAPLLVYVLRRNHSGFLRDQSAEALNFQLSLPVEVIGAAMVLAFAAHLLPSMVTLLLGVGYFLAMLLLIVYIPVQVIRATLIAGRGQVFRYPATIRLVK